MAGKESTKRKRARLSVVFDRMKTIRLRDVPATFTNFSNQIRAAHKFLSNQPSSSAAHWGRRQKNIHISDYGWP